MRRWLPVALALLLNYSLVNPIIAQKKLVLMGSSTTAGYNASSYPNCWAGKIEAYYRQNMADGLDTITINIAAPGYSTYGEMPTGYIPPPGRPTSDPNHNVTKALSYSPDVVIINLPSNDIVAGYYISSEIMNNFRIMRNTIVAAGVRCFITTSQPRNEAANMRDSLRVLKDSILAYFGTFAIDFWSDVVEPGGSNLINPPVNSGDGIHLNDLGHNYLYLRARDKQVFSAVLPLTLTDFFIKQQNNTVITKWRTEQEEPYTFFEIQRSNDGLGYQTLDRINGRGYIQPQSYEWIDQHPLPGLSFYRLHITENAREKYSKTIGINFITRALDITKLYTSNTSALFAELQIQKSQFVTSVITNMSGIVVKQQSDYVAAPSAIIRMNISDLPEGAYLFTLRTATNQYAIRRFIK